MNLGEKAIIITAEQFLHTAAEVTTLFADDDKKDVDVVSYVTALTAVLFDIEDEEAE
jgi:hypothetical protein